MRHGSFLLSFSLLINVLFSSSQKCVAVTTTGSARSITTKLVVYLPVSDKATPPFDHMIGIDNNGFGSLKAWLKLYKTNLCSS